MGTVDGHTRHAFAMWVERQAENLNCNACDGKGYVYSGDLLKPTGHTRLCTCPNGERLKTNDAREWAWPEQLHVARRALHGDKT